MVILGAFRVYWITDQYLLPFSGLICKTSRWSTSDNSYAIVLGDFKVSWITDLFRPPFLELANLDKRSA